MNADGEDANGPTGPRDQDHGQADRPADRHPDPDAVERATTRLRRIAPRPSRTPRGGTVLVADDEPDVLESTGMLVEAMGYRAVLVNDPLRVLETIEAERPGLVLQDLRMGGLNVAGLMASLRSNPDTSDIPVVFFSANADLPTTAARYDAWGYLAKPFAQEELRRLLDQVVGVPPRPGPPTSGASVRDDFHDVWNLLAALTNYVEVLRSAQGLPPDAQRAVRGLDDLMLKLESRTDRLRGDVLGALDLPPAPDAGADLAADEAPPTKRPRQSA